jgi:hypothetical protein
MGSLVDQNVCAHLGIDLHHLQFDHQSNNAHHLDFYDVTK